MHGAGLELAIGERRGSAVKVGGAGTVRDLNWGFGHWARALLSAGLIANGEGGRRLGVGDRLLAIMSCRSGSGPWGDVAARIRVGRSR